MHTVVGGGIKNIHVNVTMCERSITKKKGLKHEPPLEKCRDRMFNHFGTNKGRYRFCENVKRNAIKYRL